MVGIEGESLGIVSISEALEKAAELDIDLVEIAPQASPPVCRLMDYGKFKYAESKRQHEAKMKQKQVHVKEIKFRPGTDEGDYKIKLRNITRFIEDGDKAKITVGPEFFIPATVTIANTDFGSPFSTWNDETGVVAHEGLSYQATHMAKFISEGLLESPYESHADSIANLEVCAEVIRLIGAEIL